METWYGSHLEQELAWSVTAVEGDAEDEILRNELAQVPGESLAGEARSWVVAY